MYVERFSDLGDRVRISTDGGTAPLWSYDGTELYYRAGRAMMAVPVETGAAFTAGRPALLFEGPYSGANAHNLSPDRPVRESRTISCKSLILQRIGRSASRSAEKPVF